MSKLNINLKIAGRSFPLEVESESEERYRRAEREVNEMMNRFRSYAVDDEMRLAMAALQIALEKVTIEMSRTLGEEMDALVELDGRLGTYLARKAQ